MKKKFLTMEYDHTEFRDVLSSVLDELLERKLAAILPSILDVKLDPIMSSLDFISKGFDEMGQKILQLEKTNKALEGENKLLKEQTASLRKEVNELKIEMDEQEYGRRECLELRGIPIAAKENTDEIVQSIGSLIGEEIDDSDISISHRMQVSTKSEGSATGGGTTAITVKFTNRNVRNELYRSRSKLKNFTVSDIGLGRYSNGKIIIQESLTAMRRKLFKQCLQARKNLKYKFIWNYYGTIYLRLAYRYGR